MVLNRSDVLQFFAERPILTANRIGKAAGLSSGLLYRVLRGDCDLTEQTAEKLLPTFLLYGWNNPLYEPYAKIERKKFRKIIFPAKTKKSLRVRYVLE